MTPISTAPVQARVYSLTQQEIKDASNVVIGNIFATM